jgi:hypothetical protein
MDAIAKSAALPIKIWTFKDGRFIRIFASKYAKISFS